MTKLRFTFFALVLATTFIYPYKALAQDDEDATQAYESMAVQNRLYSQTGEFSLFFGILPMDAFKKEPPENWDIIDHPRVIVTPHIGGYTAESIDRATIAAVDNLLNVLGGQ